MAALDFGMSFHEAAHGAKKDCGTCGGKKANHPGMVQSGSRNGDLLYTPCPACFSEGKAKEGKTSMQQYLRGGDTD